MTWTRPPVVSLPLWTRSEAAAFGVRELLPDRIHADPGVLLDAIFARTLDLLNELMRLTPVERLEGGLALA